MNNKLKNKAFTLIELSIVLVIIGLIVGGVLVGQDLVHAAKTRSVIGDLEKYDTAANTFRSKYNGVPGDLKNATLFFAATSQPEQTANGNGDRLLSGDGGTGYTGALLGEQAAFYDHLALADLISLAPFDETGADATTMGVGFPNTAVGEGLPVGVSQSTATVVPSTNYYLLGASQYLDTIGLSLKARDAYIIDSKIDDGAPLTGKVVATRTGNGSLSAIFSNIHVVGNSGNCATAAAGNPYSGDEEDKCALLIKSSY